MSPGEGNDGGLVDTYFADLDLVDQMDSNKRLIREHPDDWIDEDTDQERRAMIKRVFAHPFIDLRDLFDEPSSYVLDALFEGNVGRFFNHSCQPNCIVQNVFTRTHDPRFPCIALFTTKSVKAFEELTWDYGYVVGSIPGRCLRCNCGAKRCRKKLL